jgi:hypothetical protein
MFVSSVFIYRTATILKKFAVEGKLREVNTLKLFPSQREGQTVSGFDPVNRLHRQFRPNGHGRKPLDR